MTGLGSKADTEVHHFLTHYTNPEGQFIWVQPIGPGELDQPHDLVSFRKISDEFVFSSKFHIKGFNSFSLKD